jgi:hypothetical protein
VQDPVALPDASSLVEKKSACFKNKSNHAYALRFAIHVIAEDFFALIDQSRVRFTFHTAMAT